MIWDDITRGQEKSEISKWIVSHFGTIQYMYILLMHIYKYVHKYVCIHIIYTYIIYIMYIYLFTHVSRREYSDAIWWYSQCEWVSFPRVWIISSLVNLPAFGVAPDPLVTQQQGRDQWKGAAGMQEIGLNLI